MANSAFLQLANPITTQVSFLTGWRFPTNPWQFNLKFDQYTTVTGSASYACDQTIIQNEESGQVRFKKNTSFFDVFETQTTPAGTAGRVAIIQYIDRSTAAGMISISEASSRVTCAVDSGTIDLKMSVLSFTTDTPPLAPITVWGLNPTFDPVFTELKPANDPVRTITTDFSDAQFTKFNFNSISPDAHIAIVVYSTTDLADSQTIQWGDISMVRGPNGLLSSPQTADTVLRECEYYYQQSYEDGTLKGEVTNTGAEYIDKAVTLETQGGDTWALMGGSIGVRYRQSMRDTPIHTFYSPSLGTVDLIDWQWYGYDVAGVRSSIGNGTDNISLWELGQADKHGIFYNTFNSGSAPWGALDSNATPGTAKSGLIRYHWVADARLGV